MKDEFIVALWAFVVILLFFFLYKKVTGRTVNV